MQSLGTLSAVAAIVAGCCGLVRIATAGRHKSLMRWRGKVANATMVLLLLTGLLIVAAILGWETGVPLFLAVLSVIGAAAVMFHPVAPSVVSLTGVVAALVLVMTAVAAVFA